MTAPRVAELFAGAGGMMLGFHRAGWESAWCAEWDAFPRRVLRARFPDVPLYGDVSELDGAALVAAHGPIDLLAGGSPCQDLSVAGKRAGLAGARSGLFHEQVRLWHETGALHCLWENVAGALSSHNGEDFACVLSAFVGAVVAVPSDGWNSAGVAAGPAGVAAWRLLDAQYVGTCGHAAVPQRRLRVFVLAARAGGVDPAEVLLEPESVPRDTPPRRAAGERIAGRAGVGAASEGGVAPTLCENYRNRSDPVAEFYPLAFNRFVSFGEYVEDDHASGINARDFKSATDIIVAPTITGNGDAHSGFRDADGLTVSVGIPRRLLPIECERLMAWPDRHTDVPDEKGKPASDAARYKAIGNGVASTVAEWIAERLRAALAAPEVAA